MNIHGVWEKFVYLHPRKSNNRAQEKPSDVSHVFAKVIGCKYTAFFPILVQKCKIIKKV